MSSSQSNIDLADKLDGYARDARESMGEHGDTGMQATLIAMNLEEASRSSRGGRAETQRTGR